MTAATFRIVTHTLAELGLLKQPVAWEEAEKLVRQMGLLPGQERAALEELRLYHDPALEDIERAAHLFACFYPERAWEICKEEGIPGICGQAGYALEAHRREVRASLRTWYGSPEYGSWPAEAGEEMRKREDEFKASHPEWFGKKTD